MRVISAVELKKGWYVCVEDVFIWAGLAVDFEFFFIAVSILHDRSIYDIAIDIYEGRGFFIMNKASSPSLE